MLERHARYVPVMDGTTLLGVVSFHDVAKAVLRRAELREPDAEELHPGLARGQRVRVAGAVSSACSTKDRRPLRVARESVAAPVRRRRGDCDTTDSVGSVRSAATQRRVAGLQRGAERREQRGVAIGRLDEDLRVPGAARRGLERLNRGRARARPSPAGSRETRSPGRSCPEAISASTIDDGPTSGTTAMPSRCAAATRSAPGSAIAGTPGVGQEPEVVPARGRARAARRSARRSGASPSSTMSISCIGSAGASDLQEGARRLGVLDDDSARGRARCRSCAPAARARARRRRADSARR